MEPSEEAAPLAERQVAWERSRFCREGDCVEVAHDGRSGDFLVRSSLDPSTRVRFSTREWQVFVAGVRAGDFDATIDTTD